MTDGTNILGKGGLVAQRLPGYEIRPQQSEMAEAVAAAFEAGEHLMVEAGTGVGKSFAYLIPAIEQATKNGGRVVVSTHTIALQEQLIQKDIPFLKSVMSQEFSAVLVKGRSNYVGLRRFARASAKQKELFDVNEQKDELWRLEEWAYRSEDGSLADLDRQPSPGVWERIRSDADDCMGRKCQYYGKCFYQRARRKATGAQLLIVNHALLFSDMAVRREGASILPDYQYAVLDEAHTVERVAGDHLGFGTSSTQVRHLFNTLLNERNGRGVLASRGNRLVMDALREARSVADAYFEGLVEWHGDHENWNGRLREPPPIEQRVSASLLTLSERLREIREDQGDEEDRSEFAGLMERCRAMAESVDHWHLQKSKDWVYWMTVTRGAAERVTLSARPIDVGPDLKAALFDRMKSVVLTSATLTTTAEKPFSYLMGRLGLAEARTLALGSPFDYSEQLTVHVEPDMPDPSNSRAFTEAVTQAITKYVRMSEGRAFVLFTSYGMLRQCAAALEGFFEQEAMPLLVQGAGFPRSLMLERFRTTPRSVLFGTDTFWTGVDVPGEALSNVIIVKLPFAVPNEPMVEARIEQIRESGGNPFMAFQVPEAVLKFRQGVGRLIRTRVDRGIVVILDPRVQTKPYGRQFLGALPEGARIKCGEA